MTSTQNFFTPHDHNLLHELRRERRRRREAHATTAAAATSAAPRGFGERVADMVAGRVGSWPFVIVQSLLLIGWIISNAVAGAGAWDPFPFILLNLLLSFQAAYTAPIIMMSQNRLSEIDRQHAEADFQVNVKAELEIELLHQKIDLLREKEMLALTTAVNHLLDRLDRLEK